MVIEAKVAELNLADFIYFAGYQDNVPDWLALMDLVVLASYANEGVPQSLLQAMAMARPVIGTTCGGIPEIVEKESNGLLVPPKDSDLAGRGSPEPDQKSGDQGKDSAHEAWLWCRNAIRWSRWPQPPKKCLRQASGLISDQL